MTRITNKERDLVIHALLTSQVSSEDDLDNKRLLLARLRYERDGAKELSSTKNLPRIDWSQDEEDKAIRALSAEAYRSYIWALSSGSTEGDFDALPITIQECWDQAIKAVIKAFFLQSNPPAPQTST